MTRRLLSCSLLALGFISTTAVAQGGVITRPERHELRLDRREIRLDNRELRTDRHDLRGDVVDRRGDVRELR